MTRGGGRAPPAAVIGFALLLLASTGLLLNGRWLLAEGYGRYASEHLRHSVNGANALVAAAFTTKLTPYAVAPRVVHAGLLQQADRREEAATELRQALRSGARDPFVWQRYVRLRLNSNATDMDTTRALEQVHALAPTSYWLHSENALLGLHYWNWGSAEQKQLWRASIQFVLAVDARAFGRAVIRERKEDLFCREFRQASTGLDRWCGAALAARRHCTRVPLKRGVGWCRQLGFVSDALAG